LLLPTLVQRTIIDFHEVPPRRLRLQAKIADLGAMPAATDDESSAAFPKPSGFMLAGCSGGLVLIWLAELPGRGATVVSLYQRGRWQAGSALWTTARHNCSLISQCNDRARADSAKGARTFAGDHALCGRWAATTPRLVEWLSSRSVASEALRPFAKLSPTPTRQIGDSI
jgi:hypothetical protein